LQFGNYGLAVAATEPVSLSEKVEAVAYNWGNKGPSNQSGGSITDHFSVTFDQSQWLESGDYFIQTLADDGIRVSVNGKKVIDRYYYSYSSLIDRALLTDISKGYYNIIADYREGTGSAYVFSHVVPFDNWLAYYYANSTTSGAPVHTDVVATNNGRLVEDHALKSPLEGKIPVDNFSARYVTATRLKPGNYVLRAGADDGIQVYIDGKLVLDRYNYVGRFKEDALTIKINNRADLASNQKDVHWIEVRYRDISAESRVEVFLQPYTEAFNISEADGWVGEIFSEGNFSGNSIIVGGKSAIERIENLNYSWGHGSPSQTIPKDHFSARFYKKWYIPKTGFYSIDVWADDGIRVFVDGKKVIDSWKYISGGYRTIKIPLTKGVHDIKIEYYEGVLAARLKFDIREVNADFEKNEASTQYNWGLYGPIRDKYDHFTAKIDQTQHLQSGHYFIQTLADDGIIVDVNGQVKINRWNYQPNKVNRALLLNMSEGTHSITTLYREGILSASLFSHVVRFGDWLAYYYPNESFTGTPTAARIIKGKGALGELSEVNGLESPIPNIIPNDHFSAEYVTAMKIPAGDYVLKTGADDGLQVYIDGKLVLDRFKPVGYREDSIKVTIRDHTDRGNDEKDIHWIEVKYKEGILSSRINVSLHPYSEISSPSPEDGWVGEVYPNISFSGNPVILGGKFAANPIHDLDFNWGNNSPSPLIPDDGYSTRFIRKINIKEPGYYVLNASADDGVRVYVDGRKIIDSWQYQSNLLRQAGINLTEGEHEIVVEHFDWRLGSRIKFSLEKGKTTYTASQSALAFNWGQGSPSVEVQPDNFTATFDQSQYLNSGDYFIQTLADDGVRVDVNNVRVIDRWYYSYDSLIDRAILPNLKAGTQKIVTNYREGIKNAVLFSHIVPFGDWLAYYYPNQTLSGAPIAAKIIKAGTKYGALIENNGNKSPVPGVVGEDYFSARYVTAKRIPAGEYVLRAGADDGVRVYIDGELVLDRFTNGAFREDAVKINIKNRTDVATNQDVHWIEVHYKEASQASRVEVFLQPYSEAKNISPADGWIGEFFKNQDLSGNPSVIMGGKGALVPIHNLNFNWAQDSPSPLLPEDRFSARFTKKININDPGKYAITVYADDGVRVYVNNNRIIDSWTYVPGNKREAIVDLSASVHEIVIEYNEGILGASLKFEIDKVSATSFLEIDLRKPANITAQDIINFFNRRAPDSTLKNFAQDFINVQNESGVNAQYLVAHAIWETGWGRSNLTIYKRNFFGYGAYDTCPFTCAYYFPTGYDSIKYVAYRVKTDYLTPGGKYYSSGNGPTLVGMNEKYATDPNWKNGIANLMQQIKSFDAKYYDKVAPNLKKPATPPTYGREIPSGQPYPSHIFIDFPTGVKAVTNAEVNFRSLPYVSTSTLIGTLGKNTAVEVKGYNTDVRGEWYRVVVNGRKGWLSGQYIDIQNLLKVNVGDKLNIRSGPSTSHSVITSVKNGTYLTIQLDASGKPIISNGWYKVYVPNSNQAGWVLDDYVQILK